MEPGILDILAVYLMKEKAYHEDVNKKNEIKLRKRLEKLPAFCKTFFIGIEPTTASRTRIAYAYDLGCFFEYLRNTNPICAKMEIRDIEQLHWERNPSL